MNFGISTQFFRRQEVNVDLLEELRRDGYRHFELFCNRPHLDYRNRKLIGGIGSWIRDHALPAPSIHLPFFEGLGPNDKRWLSAVDVERRVREEALDEFKRALEIADTFPVCHAVLHLGNPGDTFHPVHFDHAFAAVDTISRFSGIKVLVENIPNGMSTLDRINEWIDAARITGVGICYDSGHGEIQGPSERFERIEATHLHDNDGERDEHRWPFEGVIDWPKLILRLVSAGYKGSMLFETRWREDKGLDAGHDVRSRIEDLWHEASDSPEGFMDRYGLAGRDS